MRYKKKKRQIISAALAAMMAMQLCIPSATFAAVPTKKLKVITGFTELPEEVAHIQIPADAGENFEDYLNFPETIEASVVEYKNVNHQKNNADRDKGAEDEKAAADDRDKKEDFEIATGSNAKKENLNEEETPETENSENVPDSNDEEEADKQEVQEKDLQKDQQGTFLIATDSNAGDFLEDYEFEDEEISEDIPVLTDISVTWEPDENRKVVSIIIFRFFRESIFWQRAWSFRRSRSAWTAESLCWHQQILIILRMAVSTSTATHWNSIMMRLSREAVRPMLFWLMVWRLQSRFQIWISRYRLLRTMRQRVPGYRRSDW